MAITKKLRIDLQDLEGEMRKLQDELDALSSTELGFLDGAAAGTITASKAVIASATGTTPVVRDYVPDTAFASPTVLTAAQSGALCVFDNTAGAIFTLPAAAVGLWYDFVVVTTSSSNGDRVNCASGDFLLGTVVIHDEGAGGLATPFAFNGSTHLAINLDSDETGRLDGGFFRVTAISGTQWVITGALQGAGTLASPAETS